jgi:hypothetical protein
VTLKSEFVFGFRGLEYLICSVMSKWHEEHHIYRQCAVCKKTFRLYLSQLNAPAAWACSVHRNAIGYPGAYSVNCSRTAGLKRF